MRQGGLRDYLYYQWLRLRSSWGSAEAEEQLSQLIAIGLSASSSKVVNKKGSGAATTSEFIARALQLAKLLRSLSSEQAEGLRLWQAGHNVLVHGPAGAGKVALFHVVFVVCFYP